MEVVKEVKMKLHIETDQRTVEKEFANMFEMKVFMDSFFSNIGDRRSGKLNIQYKGPERRLPE